MISHSSLCINLLKRCVPSIVTICNVIFCVYGVCVLLTVNREYFLKPHLIFVMVKCCVLFEARTEFLNITQTSAFGSVVVSVLAMGPKIREFKPGRERWISKGAFLRKGSKAVGPMP
jgi:hypothetical protein